MLPVPAWVPGGCVAEGGKALNYFAVGVVIVSSLLSGSLIATSQVRASDHLSYASVPAGASSLARGSGPSWRQWLYHASTSRQDTDLGAPQSALAPSVEQATEARGQQQHSSSHDDGLEYKERSALHGLVEMDSPHSVEPLLNRHDGRHSSLLELVP